MAFAAFNERVEDWSNIPEAEMVAQMWPGGEQPVTNAPIIRMDGNSIMLESITPGASIGYQFEGEDVWHLYAKPFQSNCKNMKAKAIRYGFVESEVVTHVAPQNCKSAE
jgi:hypothetical protein